jgi:hypothetical protein
MEDVTSKGGRRKEITMWDKTEEKELLEIRDRWKSFDVR